MKDNKGFTLAELLAIIALIAVFALITGPNLTKQIQTSEDEGKNVLTKNIENASMIYAGKYYADMLVNNEYADIEFTLDNLIEDGLLDLDKNECKDDRTNSITISGNFNDENYGFDFSNIECYGE